MKDKDIKKVPKAQKYLERRLAGDTKKEAEKRSYGTDNHNSAKIEATKAYKDALASYLLNDKEIAKELNKNALQDKDKGAKNAAINMLLKLKSAFPKEEGSLEAGDLTITVKKTE